MIPLVFALMGCHPLEAMSPDQPCVEAGYAISSRTFECSGDPELANDRYRDFEKQFACIEWDVTDPETFNPNSREKDLFHCALEIRGLSCGTVDNYGKDLDAYLTHSPACNLVITYKDGSPLAPYQDPEFETVPCPEPDATVPANITVRNVSQLALTLYWLEPYDCTEIRYQDIPANGVIEQATYVGDRWVVRGDGGKLIDWFDATDGLDVEVP